MKLYDTEYRTNSQCNSQVWQSFTSQPTEKLVVKDIPSFHGSQSFYCRVRKDPALFYIRARPSTLFKIHLKSVQQDRLFTYNTPARSRYVYTSSAILFTI
jgi:hypothetical protein